MPRSTIPYLLKKKCVDMKLSGEVPKDIYNKVFAPCFNNPMNFDSFRRELCRWAKNLFADDTTLIGGTYENFTAHDATVQVSANGKIVQAWVKQTTNEFDPENFLDGVRAEIEPYNPDKILKQDNPSDMLEIPLFDMHWGLMYLEDYYLVRDQIYNIISEHPWEEIVFFIGQDFFHNDSIENGITSNGTQIQKVDMERAVKESREFIYPLIDLSIQNGSKVRVIYTPGNHDRSISWMFVQILMERYGPNVVDDTFEFRKCITYGANAIMVTHGDSKRATAKNLASIFPITFPSQFADAAIREVHAGHLHHEGEADIFGIMIRRLSSGVDVDAWSNRNDFVGTNRRFTIFRWSKEKLSAIYYV